MEAQGTEEDIDKVVQTLQDSRYIVINDMYVADRQPDPHETSFRIKDEY
jgi:acylphosphatase